MDKHPYLGVIFSLMSFYAELIGFKACLYKQGSQGYHKLMSKLTKIDSKTRQFSIYIFHLQKSMANLFSSFDPDPPSNSLFEAFYSSQESAAFNNLKLESSDNLGDQQISHKNEKQSIRQENFSEDRTTIKKQHRVTIGCSCRKTSCLKMYCQCLAQGKHCGQGCKCHSCKNNHQNYQNSEKQLRYKKKMKKSAKKQRKQCKCRSSQCLRKYCDCFRSNEGCSQFCKCVNCKNIVNSPNSKKQMRKKDRNTNDQEELPFGQIQLFNNEDDIDKFYA